MKSGNTTPEELLLYAVTDRAWLNGETLYEQVEKTLKGGATFIQLREKKLDEESFLQEAIEIKELCKKYNVPFVINHVGGMFGIFFTDQKQVTSYAEVMKCDTEKFKVFFHKMLDQGVYLAPSAFEAGFMSLAHTNEDIEKTLAAADIAFAAVA